MEQWGIEVNYHILEWKKRVKEIKGLQYLSQSDETLCQVGVAALGLTNISTPLGILAYELITQNLVGTLPDIYHLNNIPMESSFSNMLLYKVTTSSMKNPS